MTDFAIPSRQPYLVMCPPDHYEVAYQINPWMNPASWSVSAAKLVEDARIGWTALYETYKNLGAHIEIMPPEIGWPDLVFTANAAVVLDRKVVMARYLFPERQGEEVFGRDFFDALQLKGVVDEIISMPNGVYFEGAGDAIIDRHRHVLWTGWGQRSSFEASRFLEDSFNLRAAPLRLIDPRFYHLDTAFCVLSGGEVLYFPCAFDDEGRRLIRDLIGDSKLIAVSDADAEILAANSVSIGRDVVFGACGPELKQRLNDLGYIVHVVPLGSFGRSGGSAYCLTLRLDNRSDD